MPKGVLFCGSEWARDTYGWLCVTGCDCVVRGLAVVNLFIGCESVSPSARACRCVW